MPGSTINIGRFYQTTFPASLLPVHRSSCRVRTMSTKVNHQTSFDVILHKVCDGITCFVVYKLSVLILVDIEQGADITVFVNAVKGVIFIIRSI